MLRFHLQLFPGRCPQAGNLLRPAVLSSLPHSLESTFIIFFPLKIQDLCLRMVFFTLLLNFHRGAHSFPSLPSKQKSSQEYYMEARSVIWEGGREEQSVRLSRGGGVEGTTGD